MTSPANSIHHTPYHTPWYVVCGMWYVVCGMWYVVYGMWYVVCGMWYVVCGMYTIGHIPHTTYHIPHTTYHIPHTTYHIPHTTYQGVQHRPNLELARNVGVMSLKTLWTHIGRTLDAVKFQRQNRVYNQQNLQTALTRVLKIICCVHTRSTLCPQYRVHYAPMLQLPRWVLPIQTCVYK